MPEGESLRPQAEEQGPTTSLPPDEREASSAKKRRVQNGSQGLNASAEGIASPVQNAKSPSVSREYSNEARGSSLDAAATLRAESAEGLVCAGEGDGDRDAEEAFRELCCEAEIGQEGLRSLSAAVCESPGESDADAPGEDLAVASSPRNLRLVQKEAEVSFSRFVTSSQSFLLSPSPKLGPFARRSAKSRRLPELKRLLYGEAFWPNCFCREAAGRSQDLGKPSPFRREKKIPGLQPLKAAAQAAERGLRLPRETPCRRLPWVLSLRRRRDCTPSPGEGSCRAPREARKAKAFAAGVSSSVAVSAGVADCTLATGRQSLCV